MSTKISLGLDKGRPYAVGETITGHVTLDVGSPLEDKALVMELTGVEEVAWVEGVRGDVTERNDRVEFCKVRVVLRTWAGGQRCEPGTQMVPFSLGLPADQPPSFEFLEPSHALCATVRYALTASLESGTGAVRTYSSAGSLVRTVSAKFGKSPTSSRKEVLRHQVSAGAVDARLELVVEEAPPGDESPLQLPPPEVKPHRRSSGAGSISGRVHGGRAPQRLVVQELAPVYTLSDSCVCYMSNSGVVRLQLEAERDIVAPGENLVVTAEADGSNSHLSFPEVTLEAGVLVSLLDRTAPDAPHTIFEPFWQQELPGLYPRHLARLLERLRSGNGGGGGPQRFVVPIPMASGPSVRGVLITRCLALRLVARPDEGEVLAAMRPTATARLWVREPRREGRGTTQPGGEEATGLTTAPVELELEVGA